jgi:hypothetical protein
MKRKFFKLMVNTIPSNINKTNNLLSTQIIEQKRKIMTYDIGNPGLGLGQA